MCAGGGVGGGEGHCRAVHVKQKTNSLEMLIAFALCTSIYILPCQTLTKRIAVNRYEKI